jgi:hypothetical protein
MCRGQSNSTSAWVLKLGYWFLLLSVSALNVFVCAAGHAIKGTKCQIGAFWALWKEQNEPFQTVPPAGQTDKWKALKPRVKEVNGPKFKWAQC